jgi:hypothetical protein
MTGRELMSAIDKMAIYQKDYDAITALLALEDDRLFVKVIEEIAEGALRFTDLYRIFGDQKYASVLASNLESQQRLKEEIERTIAFRREFGPDPDYSIDPMTTKIGVTVQETGAPAKAFYDASEQDERSQQIYTLLSPDQSDDLVTRRLKLAIYSAFQSGSISEDDLMLFARDYIVPISEERQVLNGSDLSFMVENNLTEQQMKKIKALSAFLRRAQ